jgi:hypothetical protein
MVALTTPRPHQKPLVACRIERESRFVCTLATPHRFGVEPFLAEMIATRLIPGKRLPLEQFRLSCTDGYLEGTVAVSLTRKEAKKVEQTLPFFTQQLELGVTSSIASTHLLESVGGDKRALVSHYLSQIIHRFPHAFEYGMLDVAQTLFLGAPATFLRERRVAHIARVAMALYSIGRSLERQEERAAIRVVRAALDEPLGVRPIVAVVCGVATSGENEVIGQRDIESMIEGLVPDATILSLSFHNPPDRQNIYRLYIEIETAQRERAVRRLTREGASRLTRCVRELVPQLFMPRNDEEVMRGLVTLGKQLSSRFDLPQAIISFDGQGARTLSFTIIVARVIREASTPLSNVLQGSTFHLEQVCHLGILRGSYQKEGAVISVQLPSASYTDERGIVDLVAARRDAADRFTDRIGEFRDYNGGMLAKEAEQLAALRAAFPHSQRGDIGAFFRSITPSYMRAAAPLELLEGAAEAALARRIGISHLGRYRLVVTDRSEPADEALFSGSHDGVACAVYRSA